MKFLFVIERFYPYHDASAKVLKNFFSSTKFSNHEVHVLSIGNHDRVDDNLIIHELNHKDRLLFKVINKIQSEKFVFNKKLINVFAKRINTICEQEGINNVTFVLGNMNFLKIQLPDSINVNYIFYDTFFENFFYKKEKLTKIIKIQTKAFLKARNIFLLEEYKGVYSYHHPEFIKKFKNFYITAFYDNTISKTKSIPGLLLHTGAFFKGLRDPKPFFDFLDFCERHEIHLKSITLGELPKSLNNIKVPSNLTIKNRVFGNEYTDLVHKSEILVLIDNCEECKQIPSKTYEYIGYNKKILFFTSGNTNTCKLLEDNKNVFIVDEEMDQILLDEFYAFVKKDISNERSKYFMNEKDYVATIFLEANK